MLSPCRLLALVLLLALTIGSAAAQVPSAAPAAKPAAPAPAAETSASQAQDALEVLRDDKRRAELIATLEAIAKAAPAAAPAPTVPVVPLAPDALGVQLVRRASTSLSAAGTQFLESVKAVNDLPLLSRWLMAQASDPDARAQIGDAAWKMAVVLLCGIAAEWGTRLLFRRLRATITAWAPHSPTFDEAGHEGTDSGLEAAEAGEIEHRRRLGRAIGALRRLPFLLGRLLLDVLPLAAFLVVGNVLLATKLGSPDKTRLVILQAIEAYAYARAILLAVSLLVSPASPRLRLLHVSDWAAAFLTRWARRIVILAMVGIASTDIGLLFGMYRTAHDAVLKLFGLAIHICLVIAVLQAREPVAKRLRARRLRGVWASMLNRLADIWHFVAIFYIVALWLVWAVELRNGYVRLIDFCVSTFLVLLLARLLAIMVLGGLDRVRAALQSEGATGLAVRAGSYYPLFRIGVITTLWTLTAIALLEAWGFGALGWLASGGLGGRVLSAVLLIGATVLAAVVLWEAVNTAIERHLMQLSSSAQLARAGRLRTLLPLLRSVLLATIVLIVALMALSEIGVNIAPLLAGAGVVGIAVGFGSQKLVQDLITGLFLLLENAMQVGDVVTVAGLTGTVEALSIRTIKLRALDGAVHLIPFSSVTTVTNQTRDYSYAVLDVSVGLNEEPDPVTDIIRDVAATMQADPSWQSMVLDKLDVMGIEKLTDLAWILRVRMKTQPGSRWAVARELNRRIKNRFDELAIESPFTSHKALGREAPTPTVSPAEQPEQEKAA